MHIYGATADQLLLERSNANDVELVIKNSEQSWVQGIDRSESNHYAICTGDSVATNKKIVIQTDGKVGIGSADPEEIVNVASAGAVTPGVINDLYSATTTRFPWIGLRKSGSNTKGTVAATEDGDILGKIVFKGVDSGSSFFRESASIIATASGAPDADTQPGMLQFATSNTTSNSVKMTINHLGYVGINTTTPAIYLHNHGSALIGRTSGTTGGYVLSSYDLVLSNGSSETAILLYNSAGAFQSSLIKYDANCLKLGLNSSNSTNAISTATAVNVGSIGVGIGTVTPGALLEVYAASSIVASHVKSGTVISRLTANSTSSDGTVGTSSAHDFLIQRAGSTRITLSGSSVVVNDSGEDIDFRVEGDTDTNLIRTDAANERVGIGTNAPSSKLHVNSEISCGADDNNRAMFGYTPSRFYLGTRQSGTNYLNTVSVTSGKVGIGTDAPAALLNLFKTGANDAVSSAIYLQRAAGNYGAAILQVGNGSSGSEKLMFTAGHNSDPMSISNAKMTIQQDGNVGIGTTDPKAPVHLFSNGSGNTQETVLCLGSNTSNRPSLQFSENQNAGFDTGMSIEYRGDFGAGGANGLTINGLGADATTSGAAIATFLSGGSVGIGTTNPGNILHVKKSTAGTAALFEAGGTNVFVGLKESGGNFTYIGNDAGKMLFQTSGSSYSTKLIIQTDGNVGIGTVTPGSLLSVSGNSDDGDGACTIAINDEDSDAGSKLPAIQFYGGGTTQGRIRGGDTAFSIAVGSSPTTALSINTTSRKLTLGSYGGGTHTGTLAKSLGVDSSGNVIEFTGGGGTVTGSGTTNYVPKFTSSTALGNSALYDGGGSNIGIGTNNPYYALDVRFTNNTTSFSGGSSGNWGGSGLRLQNASTTAGAMALIQFRTSTTEWFIGNKFISSSPDKSDFIFNHEDSEKVRFTNDGKVGIGTNVPAERLHVYKSGTDTPLRVETTSHVGVELKGGTSHDIYFLLADTSTNAKIGWDHSATALKFNASASFSDNHLVVKSTGVGIGTDAPGQLLHVYKAGVLEPNFQSTTGRVGLQLNAGAAGDVSWILYSGYPAAGDFNIRESGVANHFVIKKTTGSVGIGNDSPSFKLQVNGDIRINSGTAFLDDGQSIRWGGTAAKIDGSSGGDYLRFYTDGVERMRIISGGAVGIGTDAPDSLLMVYKSGADSIIHVRGAAGGGDARVRINGYESSELYIDRNNVGRFAFRRTTGTDDLSLLKLNDNYTDNSTIMFWDYSSGSVGIGTNAPSEVLQVKGNIIIRGETNNRLKIANDSNNNWAEIGNDGATGENTLEFFTGSSSTSSLSITNGGYAAFAYASQVRLTLGSTGTAGGNDANWIRSNGANLEFNAASGDFNWEVGGAHRMRLTDTGFLGIGLGAGSDPVYSIQANGTNGGIIGVTRTSGSTTGTLGHVRFGNTNVDSDLANIKGVQDGATDSARLEFETQAAGGSATARLTIKSDGVVDINSAKLKINGGSGTDGQVLTTDGAGGIAWETSPGAGSVDGSGTANYVAKWSDSDTIANSVLRDDGNRLAVGAAPSSAAGILHLKDVTSNQAKMTLESANAYNSWINFSAASDEMSIGYDKSTVGGFVFANADALNSNIRMVILSGGSVGIGTNAPDVNLHIYSASSPQFRIQDSTNNCILKAYAQNSDAFVGTHSNHSFIIGMNNTTKITVASALTTMVGEVLITTGSTSVRTLSGVLKVDTIENNSGASNLKLQTESGGNKHIEITPDGTGNVGIGTATPSLKFQVHSGDILITSGKQLISTNSYTQAPPAMLTTQGPSTGATSLGTGTWGIMLGPQHTRSSVANTYYPGIAFNHLLNNGGVVTYNNHPQAWIGTRLHDTPGSERAFLVFSTKGGTGVSASDVPLERMCIDPVDGFVGIGTTNPQVLLDVYRTDSDTARFESTSTSRSTVSIRSGSGGDAQVRFQNGAASKWSIGNDGGDSDKFKIAVGSGAFSTSEAVAISTSGCVGIGTNSPLEPLHVYDGGDWQIRMSSGGARAGLVIDKPGTTTTMGSALVLSSDETYRLGTASYYHVVMTQAGVTSLLYQGNTKIATTSSGVTVTGTLTETSSITLKENVETYTPSLDIINKIRPVKYNRKTNKDKKEIGLIAEELAELFPELVEKDEKGNPSSVNYSRAVTVLLGGFKELYKEIEELKKRI